MPADHVGGTRYVLNSSIAAKDVLAQTVAAVAESGLPRNGRIGKIQRDRNGIGNFAAIFFRKYAAGHIRGTGRSEIKQRHNPGDLVDHIFRVITAGEHPVETPVHKLVGVKTLVRPAIQERWPIYILGGAIGGRPANPLTLTVRSVAAHPGINLRDFAENAV